MRAADGLRLRLADAERAHLALFDQFRHGAERLFNRHRRVDPVLVIKIDDIDAEPLQARLARTQYIFGASIGDLDAAAAEVAELRRQNDSIAAAFDRLADEFLIVAEAVHVGRVEKGSAVPQRRMNDRDAAVVRAVAVDAGQRHAAKPDRRDFKSGRSEPALW